MLVGLRNVMPVTDVPWWGLTFTAQEAGSTVSMAKASTPPVVYLETSVDGGATWQTFTVGSTTIVLPNVGDKVFFRAGVRHQGKRFNYKMSTSQNANNYFVMSGRIAASGDVTSLLDASQPIRVLKNSGDGDNRCAFAHLFVDCAALTQAPTLAATQLSDRCYYGMFQRCSGLVSVQEELPAMELALECYTQMYISCTSLTKPPRLPAVALADSCYTWMFAYDTALRDLDVGFTSWTSAVTQGNASTARWLYGVPKSPGVVFRCPAALDTDTTYDDSHVPYRPGDSGVGWEIVKPQA